MENLNFEIIAKSYDPLIKSQIKALSIYKDFDDYYQEGLIGLWEAWKRFDQQKGEFSTFAYATIRGKLMNRLQREKNFEDKHHLDEKENPLLTHHDVPFEYEQIKSYMITLSPREQMWVMEAVINQKKQSEIAAELGVSVETVKTWRKNALKKLRNK